MLAPILFLCLASSNISKGQFQKEGFHLLFPFPFATVRCKICYALRRALYHAKDSQCRHWRISSCIGCFRAVDLSRIGCFRAVDFSRSGMLSRIGCFTQWILSRSGMLSRIGCFRAVVFIAQWDVVTHRMDFTQWILSRSGMLSCIGCFRAEDFPAHMLQVALRKLLV
jgi:hypothetical protein